jgi:hypothetical protein
VMCVCVYAERRAREAKDSKQDEDEREERVRTGEWRRKTSWCNACGTLFLVLLDGQLNALTHRNTSVRKI